MNSYRKYSTPIVWKVLITVFIIGFLFTFFGVKIVNDNFFNRTLLIAIYSSNNSVLGEILIILLVSAASLAGFIFTWLNRQKLVLAATAVLIVITIYGVTVVTNTVYDFNLISSFFSLSVIGLIIFNILAVKYTKESKVQPSQKLY